ncbi:hypothetical protein RFI_21590 [Reticulomyxa filosa]|uniref:Protein kinase domain-containing protein n=1 Tax=Reticulomyxa filosa TaxID=46433 RepID=X6MPI8_RETFI|nr:hypothetical protein RFI_21590 [Reticulomyxa filosa]|eukprot:ETO15774.1 hypothetical protein RFI_21590 [Reticulomyxa filosa]
MLFMMLIGAPPPIRDKVALPYIVSGRLKLLLEQWKRAHLVNGPALDCLNRMLTLEKHRITMDKLLAHPFVAEDMPAPDSPVAKIETAKKFVSDWRKLRRSKISVGDVRDKLLEGESIMNTLLTEKKQLAKVQKKEAGEKGEKGEGGGGDKANNKHSNSSTLSPSQGTKDKEEESKQQINDEQISLSNKFHLKGNHTTNPDEHALLVTLFEQSIGELQDVLTEMQEIVQKNTL